MNTFAGVSEQLPAQLDQVVRAELDTGEQIIWCAQPRPWGLVPAVVPVFLAGFPFFGFAVMWEVMALLITKAPAPKGTAPPPDVFRYFFPIWGIPFLLVGAAMLLSPIAARIRAARTAYALTTSRAIVIEGKLFGREVLSYKAGNLPEMSRRDRSGDWGDLIFERVPGSMRRAGWGRRGQVQVTVRGFLGINNVGEVGRLVRDTLGA